MVDRRGGEVRQALCMKTLCVPELSMSPDGRWTHFYPKAAMLGVVDRA